MKHPNAKLLNVSARENMVGRLKNCSDLGKRVHMDHQYGQITV